MLDLAAGMVAVGADSFLIVVDVQESVVSVGPNLITAQGSYTIRCTAS